ncbi:hypothetical protein JW835_04280 [bacterium]|nr:hypothetical protein [bacterium]
MPESVIPDLETLDFDSFESFYQHIPYEGSLGILALGAMGLLAWRKKRKEIEALSEKADQEPNNG